MEENVIEKLSKQNFKFKHSLGQNFLTDNNLLKSIVADAEIKQGDNVLEIGAGAGTLSRQILLSTTGKVVCVEVDKTIAPTLTQNLSEFKNVQIVFDDILKIGTDKIKEWFDDKPFKVVANLPYYISSPIIFYLIESGLKIESLTIMLQLELAQRLCAKFGSKDYGAAPILLSLISNTNITRKVPKTMFTPQPKVDSALLKIDILKKYDIDYLSIAPFIRGCFSMKRKTLLNNVSNYLKIKKDDAKVIFEKAKIDCNKRPEQLSVEQFIELYNYAICKKNC